MKTVLILPAYTAGKTLIPLLKSLPKNVFDEIILGDDCSQDATFLLSKKQKGIRSYQTLRNLGYGGNLKFCLSKALERGAEVIVEIHPDGEYLPGAIPSALEEVEKGAKLVLGNRFTKETDPRKSGMFGWKYPVLRLLNGIDNLFLGTSIPDLHQGFRVYTASFLKRCDYRKNANNFVFSFQIIVQAIYLKQKIASVPVRTRYVGKKRGALLGHSTRYTMGTFFVLLEYFLAKNNVKKGIFAKPHSSPPVCILCDTNYFVRAKERQGNYTVYFCDQCMVGFTSPQETHIAEYYPKHYWIAAGIIGNVKNVIFAFFQQRRKTTLFSYLTNGVILDIGSGEGGFGQLLGRYFQVTNLEMKTARILNPSVLKTDFLLWRTKQRFDAVTFWESLEHVPDPKKYLEKAMGLLKKDGYIFIECPRYTSLESMLFGRYWFHLDMPRHTFHFTDKGLSFLLERCGLQIIERKNILAPEYTIWGLVASLLARLGIRQERVRWGKVPVLVVGVIILPLALIVELFLYCIDAPPIRMVVAKK